MNRFPLFASLLVAISLLFAGCGGSGDPADPPADVTLTPGDMSINVTWTMQPGVEYWLYYAPRDSISPEDWMGADSRVITAATSPVLVSGIPNGITYSFTIDGRYGQGPGGVGSPSKSATARLAGGIWEAGASVLGAADLRGVAFGSTFVAVGADGKIYASTDGKTWVERVSPVTTALNAVVYGGVYVAAGDGGKILRSSDAISWTPPSSGITTNINALATNGVGSYVAVGDGGRVLRSTGGDSWIPATTSPTPNLTGVTYGVVSGVGTYVAVGESGAVWTSTDGGDNWLKQTTTVSAANLRGVAWGAVSADAKAFIAVGVGGTVITSGDGVTWTAAALPGTPQMNAITFGHQFIAVGDGGAIFFSQDGVSWSPPTTNPSTSDLRAITHNTVYPYGYSVVGNAGANLTSY